MQSCVKTAVRLGRISSKLALANRCLPALTVAALLGGCIYLPQTTTVYDPYCQILARKMVLQAQQVAALGGCANEGCVALLVAAGAVTAASAVVSGSIVVAGNVVYWFEKQGQCVRKEG